MPHTTGPARSEHDALRRCPHCKTHLDRYYLVTVDELHRWHKIVDLIREEIKILMEVPSDTNSAIRGSPTGSSAGSGKARRVNTSVEPKTRA